MSPPLTAAGAHKEPAFLLAPPMPPRGFLRARLALPSRGPSGAHFSVSSLFKLTGRQGSNRLLLGG